MPLLGNPTAAVLYPGKLVFAVLPYVWGARLYAVAHTLLAFGAMLALMRNWGTSWAGSTLSALAYAFGAPILFQYCNIIFLVGAAWIPLGFRAVDRWLRLGRRFALLELAAVLALQTLGGDPESTYITGVCAGGYALGLAALRHRAQSARPARRMSGGAIASVVGLVLAGWVAAVLVLGWILPSYRPPYKTPLVLPWMPYVPMAIVGLWGAAGLVALVSWVRRRFATPLVPMLAGLAGAAGLAALLGSAQLLPVFEFTAQSGRAAGGGPHDIFPFSLEPVRLVELAWPNVFGTHFEGNRSWLDALPPRHHHAKVWVPSLYLGGLTFVLALSAFGFRNGPPWRGWLSAVVLVSLIASLGEYSSPLWWGRWNESYAEASGPHDPNDTSALRMDRKLRDGDGGAYWLLATVLPGFRQFRFPSKLLTFTTLGLAGLAGLGWDRLTAGHSRRTAALASAFAVGSVVLLAGVLVAKARILAAFSVLAGPSGVSPFGPFDAAGAFGELTWALGQGAVVYGLALVLVLRGRRGPVVAGAIALIVSTADLAVANARYVLTVPQALMDEKPKVLALIEEAERQAKDPNSGPFRVHRMPIWNPVAWFQSASSDRVRDFVEWERATIQPKYGIPYGVQYTMTLGVAELYDYEWFFGGFLLSVDERNARRIAADPKEKIVVFPRRAFDLWTSRYFILPGFPNKWTDENRSFAAFLDDTEQIYPPPGSFDGPGGDDRRRRWIEDEDLQIRRNLKCYPRAWVVHSARHTKPVVGLGRTGREGPMQEILFEDDHFWYDPSYPVHDPRKVAWIDESDLPQLGRFVADRTPAGPSGTELVTITSFAPQRVELDAVLDRPGLVVLADVYYPGWKLTIDDKPAPVYRANRLMRGAAVEAGKHHLVYTFDPESFHLGSKLSLAGLVLTALLGAIFAFRPVSARLAGDDGVVA